MLHGNGLEAFPRQDAVLEHEALGRPQGLRSTACPSAELPLLCCLLEEKVNKRNKGHAVKLPVGTAYLQAGPVPLLIACDDLADPPSGAKGRAADL